ncbi:MAG: hypothetical protein U0821_23640 [Chloroflexota bacterium]
MNEEAPVPPVCRGQVRAADVPQCVANQRQGTSTYQGIRPGELPDQPSCAEPYQPLVRPV